MRNVHESEKSNIRPGRIAAVGVMAMVAMTVLGLLFSADGQPITSGNVALQEVIRTVDTVSDLATLTGVRNGGFVFVRGTGSVNDGGARFLQWDTSEAHANADGGAWVQGPDQGGSTGVFKSYSPMGLVNVLWYGDITSDNEFTQEFNQAAEFAQSHGLKMYIPYRSETYTIIDDANSYPDDSSSDGVGVNIRCDVVSDPQAIIDITDNSATGLNQGAVFVIGPDPDAAGGTVVSNLDISLPIIRMSDTSNDWAPGAVTTDVGVHIEGVRRSHIHINKIDGFATNILFRPDSDYGPFDNTISFNWLQDGYEGIKITPGTQSGVANENIWRGGRISMDSSFNGGSLIANSAFIKIDQVSAGNFQPNNHNFYGINLECGSNLDDEIYCRGSLFNTFMVNRYERASGSISVEFDEVDASNGSDDNLVMLGRGSTTVVVTESSNSQNNVVWGTGTYAMDIIGASDVTINGESSGNDANINQRFANGEQEFRWRLDGTPNDEMMLWDITNGTIPFTVDPNSSTDSLTLEPSGVTVGVSGDQTQLGAKTSIGTGSTLTISSGIITVTDGYHVIDTEMAAATDELITINPDADPGTILVLRTANSGRDVTLEDNTDNLRLGGNVVLNDTTDTVTLIYNGTAWLLLATEDN